MIKQEEPAASLNFFRSIQGKLLFWFLLFALTPLAVLGVMLYGEVQKALRQEAFIQMADDTALKKNRMLRVWNRWKIDLLEMAKKPAIVYDMEDLSNGFRFLGSEKMRSLYLDKPKLLNAMDGSAYSTVHQEQHASLPEHKQLLGIADILMLNNDGDVIYSSNKGRLFGVNLLSGPLKDTNLGALYRRLKSAKEGEVCFVDVGLMDGEPVMFVGAPVFTGPVRTGALVYQLPFALLNSIVNDGDQAKEGRQIYLVGPDKRMRSDSRLSPETHSVKASLSGAAAKNGVDTVASQKALAGETGTRLITDYRGVKVLSSYAPVSIEGIQWAVIAEVDEAKAFALARNLRNMTWMIGGGVALIIALCVFWIAATLSRPIRQITETAMAVKTGNLDVTAHVKTRDEVGILADAFNGMVQNLKKSMENLAHKADQEQKVKADLEDTVRAYVAFVEKVGQGDLTGRLAVVGDGDLSLLAKNLNVMTAGLHSLATRMWEATTNISSAATEILATTSQQAATTSQQAASVNETTSTVQEVRQTAEQSHERVQMVSQMAQESTDASKRGLQAVAETVASMDNIKEQVAHIAETILTLSEQTLQIGDINATVDDIADQSNLLALNAAIEAARAGEAGKGFAVVAGEVRGLAEKSRQATAKVKEILGEIQKAANTAVMVTEEGARRTEAGQQLARATGEAIEAITTRIEKVAAAAQQISASTRQQLAGMDQVASAMESIDQAASQTEAGTQQAEKAAAGLNALAEQIKEIVAQYKLS